MLGLLDGDLEDNADGDFLGLCGGDWNEDSLGLLDGDWDGDLLVLGKTIGMETFWDTWMAIRMVIERETC